MDRSVDTSESTRPSPSAARWVENRPSRGLRWPDLRELWHYRELAGFFALRDLKVRYKQAVLGIGWALLQPVAGVVVFSLVFRKLVNVPSEGVPYPVFSLAGLALWSYASSGVTRATQSLVTNSTLVTKVYFPRLLAPVAAVIPGLLDLLIALVLLAVLLPVSGVVPGIAALTVPVWILAAVVAVLGIGVLLGTLNVTYRDVSQAIALLVQLWLFVTPVAYPSRLVGFPWRPLYFANPMAGVIEGFRWAVLGTPWPGSVVWISIASAMGILACAVALFEASERRFADVI